MNPILGLDFGRVRIGVAISDELQFLAHPLETVPADKQATRRLLQIICEKQIDHVVVGIPRQMNG
jgi:putative Holliday junction resolvase